MGGMKPGENKGNKNRIKMLTGTLDGLING